MANNIKRQFAADEEKGFNGMSVGETDTGWPVTIQESTKLSEAKNIIAYLTRKGFYNYLNEDIIFINDRLVKPLDVILCLDERGAKPDQIVNVLKRYITASKQKLEQEGDKDKNKWELLQMDLALRALIEESYKLNYNYILNENATTIDVETFAGTIDSNNDTAIRTFVCWVEDGPHWDEELPIARWQEILDDFKYEYPRIKF